ncbi:MAG: DEAD/DEAH box helicase [Lachnospiraceae bacterium]|nr:DEAD/DEAH box helicase [Lachnospiraceae bacterium]
MEKLDFKEINNLLTGLEDLDRSFEDMFLSRDGEEEAIRSSSRVLAMENARTSLSQIPTEELKKARAGIRVASLEEAGFTDLEKLSRASNWELSSIDGIGEKQIESIRNIIAEFTNRLASYSSVRLSGKKEENSELSFVLMEALSIYRHHELVRRDASPLRENLHYTIQGFLSAGIIKSRLKWFFSSKTAKADTISTLNTMTVFIKSPFYERVKNLLAGYREAMELSRSEVLADFNANVVDYYTLLERVGGQRMEKPLIYSSVPAELAESIDALPLDLDCFRGELRAYQTFGTKYILHQKKVLLGDEMGLGKTVQAIAAMSHIYSAEPDSFFLVVCPASVLINWCREIKKFSPVNTFLLHGFNLEDSFAGWQERGGAAVTNYESMGKIVERIDNHMRLSLLVIDEAHYIKNPEARRTKHIHMLENEAERILMMTGTPLENHVEEMCSLIDFIRPDMSSKIKGAAQLSHAAQFREMLAPVYLRRLREQVLSELPEFEEENEWCAMTDEDRSAYLMAVQEQNFTKMRRVSFLQDGLSSSSKALRLKELCAEAKAEGRKILIYSFFRETISKLHTLLEDVCIGEITGDTPINARQALIDRLTGAEDGSILLCQIQAGGTGLNIQAASIVIFCEPQIKPSLTAQAISRVYRMGQVRNVLVYHLLCENTIDEAMMELLEEKQLQFDTFADESSMAEATMNLVDKEWISDFMEAEKKKYALAVCPQYSPQELSYADPEK